MGGYQPNIGKYLSLAGNLIFSAHRLSFLLGESSSLKKAVHDSGNG